MLSPEDEYKKSAVDAQLDLMKVGLQRRNQTVITIAVISVAIIGASNLIQPGHGLTFSVTGLLILSLIILWWDISDAKSAIERSMEIIYRIMGPKFKEEEEKKFKETPWYKRYFPEVAATLFSVVVVVFIYLILINLKTTIGSKQNIFYFDHPAAQHNRR